VVGVVGVSVEGLVVAVGPVTAAEVLLPDPPKAPNPKRRIRAMRMSEIIPQIIHPAFPQRKSSSCFNPLGAGALTACP
jgi:hypothetical protein